MKPTKLRLAIMGTLIAFAAGCSPKPLVYPSIGEAAAEGDYADIKRHLQKGADVNETSADNWTPLMMATYRNDLGIIRFLMDQGADVGAKNSAGATPLMIAACYGYLKAAKYLVGQGADVNARTMAGETSLMIAVSNGHQEVADYLLDQGAEVNAKDTDGSTALMKVAVYKKLSIVKKNEIHAFLIRHGATDQASTGAVFH